MERLIILRHAKTQPDAPRGDKARELTAIGRQNAEALAPWIAQQNPDLILVSPATRAQQTYELATAALTPAPRSKRLPAIYNASVHALLDLVREHERAQRVLIVGHNPGFEELATHLAGDSWLETAAHGHMRPGAAVVLDTSAGLQAQGCPVLDYAEPSA